MKKFLPIFNRILLPLALLLMAVQMRAESRSLKFSDVVLTPGGTAEMTVSYVTDYTDLTALQLNFILPEGITLADARVSSSLMQACPDLYFSYSPTRDDGTSVIMCYYLNGTLPTGSQETFVLTLKADANIAQRTYGIATTHIEFVHHNVDVPDIADSQSFFITVSKPAFSTLRGDVNNDRAISLTDVSMMASRIMKVDDGDFLAYNADVNGDGDITLADLMMLVNIILGNPDGLSFRWFLIALQSNGNAQPIPLDNVGSLAPAGDYDFTILDKGGNIILDNVTRAEFKYEYELETAGYSVPANVPAAYNIATYATRPMAPQYRAATAQSQNAFLLSDKAGNSLFSQTVTFQPADDGMAWNTGTTTGDIGGLKFIARTNVQMATGSGDDIIQMLEELSGTGNADAEALVATLANNPDVEDACTGDGRNVGVKLNNDDGYVFYPMYDMESIFTEEDIPEPLRAAMDAPKKALGSAQAGMRGTIAIFNYFRGNGKYVVQNRIIENLIYWFNRNGYTVEEYGDGAVFRSGDIAKDMPFTLENVKNVLNRGNTKYKAVIFMTHGVIPEGRTPLIATRDEKGDAEFGFNDPDDKVNHLLVFVEDILKDVSSPIVYLGACDGVNQGGFLKSEDRFPRKENTCVVGWAGKTRIAQAHAALLFYYMLYGGYTMPQALVALPSKDSNYSDSQLYKWNVSELNWLGGDDCFEYNENFTAQVWRGAQKADQMGNIVQPYQIEFTSVPYDCWATVQLRNVVTGEAYPVTRTIYPEKNKKITVTFKVVEDGIYSLEIYPYNKVESDYGSKRIKLIRPVCLIKSDNFKDLSATLDFSEEDTYAPSVLGSDGQQVTEISIPAGSSQTYQLDAYAGHSFDTPCLDTGVATVSISGTTLTVKGVSEGSTHFGVFDRQNHHMAVVKVTVGPGGSQSYLTCPDDHHPHLIDLGLPSGTKWACCNVADNPAEQAPTSYGSYYAWGETSGKDYYDWSTYIHCDGSDDTCHNLGSDIAGTQYDVAHVRWGGSWVMPSKEQQDELRNNCTSEWTTVNGVNGRIFKGPNGGSIFLPAAGDRWLEYLDYAGSDGYYWSSTQDPSDSYLAYDLVVFYSGYVDWSNGYRDRGFSVRPVSR